MPTTQSPNTTEDLSAAIQQCAAQGRIIAPTGGRTKLHWGNPVPNGNEVTTTNLTGVREHSWGDLTATVAAGTPWAAMQQALAKQNQRVALDPLFPNRATVGGILATNDSGLLRMKYGSLRDLVLGMTIVLADGTIARTGGKVVKNVAGYDLPKLLTGSYGTLGIITEATFRLHTINSNRQTWTVRSPSISDLADLMSRLLSNSGMVESLQLRNETASYALDVRFGLPADEFPESSAITSTTLEVSTGNISDDLWLARERLFANPEATVLKITCLSTKLAAITSGIAALNAMPEHTAQCVADPVGIVTAALTANPEAIATIVADLRARLLATGGTVVILQRGGLPATADVWGPPPAAFDVMRAIKREFDPQNLLNPGKFVGGL